MIYNENEISNYGIDDIDNDFKQLYDFIPNSTFRMLICGPSGSGKTNVLINMVLELLYYDKIYIYGKNLQSRYRYLEKKMRPISEEAGYDVVETYICFCFLSFLRCVYYKFPNMYSNVKCKLVRFTL